MIGGRNNVQEHFFFALICIMWGRGGVGKLPQKDNGQNPANYMSLLRMEAFRILTNTTTSSSHGLFLLIHKMAAAARESVTHTLVSTGPFIVYFAQHLWGLFEGLKSIEAWSELK